MGYIIAFVVGAWFGIFTTALIAAGSREDDETDKTDTL